MTDAIQRQTAGARELRKVTDFRVGQVIVRPDRGTADGPGGTVQLDPRVLDVLICLATADGEVVHRDTLMQQVWGNIIVTDFALSRCIYQLRKRLSKAAQTDDSPIETLPKRGYRLTWRVDRTEPVPDRRTKQGFRGLAVGVLFGALLLTAGIFVLETGKRGDSNRESGLPASGSPIRLAVFPLDDLSDEGDQAQFARGLARELIHELARLPGLVVMGRTSTFGELPATSTELDHASRLGVDYALEGSVIPVGNSRRVLLQLIRVANGEQVWGRSFLLEHSTPIQVFREVAQFAALLSQSTIEASKPKGSTDNLEALELYLAALETDNLETKRMLLGRVVEIDPEFANAWIALASIEVLPVWDGKQTVEAAWGRARPYLDRAFEIDPESSRAYVELGRFQREFGHFDEAIRYLRKALELDPGDVWASANLGLVLRMTGRFEEALILHERDAALDPLDTKAQIRLGTSNWFVENFDEATLHYQRALEINPRDKELYDSWSGMLGAGLGRFDEALLMMQKKLEIESPPSPRTLSFLGELANTLGLEEDAEIFWREILQTAPNHSSAYSQRATHYMTRDETGLARAAAQRALELFPADLSAHLILATLDLEEGKAKEFLARVDDSFGEISSQNLTPRLPEIEAALLKALALQANGRHGDSTELLHAIEGAIQVPLAREHFWLAAMHAMMGRTAEALAELQASPPGRVRSRARLLMRDPRFSKLRDVPEFQHLVAEHRRELERQRAAYLSNSLGFRTTAKD